MLAPWRRIAPFVLTALLILNLVAAIRHSDRLGWLMVGLVALATALSLWWNGRTTD